MEATVTYNAQTTADTELVIFRMELVLDVKLDIEEPFVNQVFLFRFFFRFSVPTEDLSIIALVKIIPILFFLKTLFETTISCSFLHGLCSNFQDI